MCVCATAISKAEQDLQPRKKLKTLLRLVCVWLQVYVCVCEFAGAEVEVRVSTKVELNLANVSALLLPATALLLPSNCLNC